MGAPSISASGRARADVGAAALPLDQLWPATIGPHEAFRSGAMTTATRSIALKLGTTLIHEKRTPAPSESERAF